MIEMNRRQNPAREAKRNAVKKADDLRQLVIRLQNDPVAMRQARKLIEAI